MLLKELKLEQEQIDMIQARGHTWKVTWAAQGKWLRNKKSQHLRVRWLEGIRNAPSMLGGLIPTVSWQTNFTVKQGDLILEKNHYKIFET